ncbi:N-acetylglutamate synthase-like GNAT family acetyltransferase [Actinoplanes tereljensis]|uniref:Acetyltransferase n=1 Tax=Paractinoplanes tereljensis TaxID=571912 RepID=A0A919NMH6_9ACTN|nr:GNAT family N-acetyltransferase [Actinoplanes tereljensis]GIF21534.1 acetyltransferase [Actinoplanes tereljensis]
MVLRVAQASDVASIQQLVRAAFQRYVPRIGREPAPMGVDYAVPVAEGRCWVVEHDGRIAGMVQLAARDGYLEVETIAVADGMQGNGVGTRLLAYAEEKARELGLPEVRLYTNEAMTENLEYYPRRGFREIDRATHHGYRRVFFAKPIA